MAVRHFPSSLLVARFQNYSFNAINIVTKRTAFSLIILMALLSSLYRGSGMKLPRQPSPLCDTRVQAVPPNHGCLEQSVDLSKLPCSLSPWH